jgi:hypothetical protein
LRRIIGGGREVERRRNGLCEYEEGTKREKVRNEKQKERKRKRERKGKNVCVCV